MKTILILILGLIFSLNIFSQEYPNNEDGEYQDMLTPAYYNTPLSEDYRTELNTFVHFARLTPFQNPVENSSSQIPTYTITRGFGEELTQNEIILQHHPAIDLHFENNQADIEMFASMDGYIQTYEDAPKYRDYLSITKDVEDNEGNILGKIVVIYAHIDLELDIANGLLMEGQYVNKGDLVSNHLYSQTVGGPHLHYEIRYYKTSDVGNEEFYGWAGGNTAYTEPSAGIWEYGAWDPNFGYGFADPENYLNYSPINIKLIDNECYMSIYPNPVSHYLELNTNYEKKINIKIFDITGKTLLEQDTYKNTKINIQNFEKGIFIVQIKTQKKVTNFKIIKNQ